MPEYPPNVTLDPNVPIQVTLSFDDFKSGTREGKDGMYTWYMYGVTVGGERQTLFPPGVVHQIIQEKGYKRGSVLTLEKHVHDKETWYTVNGETLDDVLHKGEAPKSAQPVRESLATGAATKGEMVGAILSDIEGWAANILRSCQQLKAEQTVANVEKEFNGDEFEPPPFGDSDVPS